MLKKILYSHTLKISLVAGILVLIGVLVAGSSVFFLYKIALEIQQTLPANQQISLPELREPFIHVLLWFLLGGLILSGIIFFLIHLILSPFLLRLESNQARLNSILETAADGIITINNEGIIESINRVGEKMFGYTREEILGKNVRVLMPTPYYEEHNQYLQNYLKTGERKVIGIGREVMGKRKDGSVFPMDLAVGEVKLPQGILFSGICRDITDRKSQENELKQNNEELKRTQVQLIQSAKLASLGEMATGIAHELNQPLATISTNAEMMLEFLESATSTEFIESYQLILNQVDRASQIIRHLKTFGRESSLESCKLVPLNTLIENATTLLKEQFRLRGIEVLFDLTTPSPVVWCNTIQIEQVLTNLLLNARDALEKSMVKRLVLRSFILDNTSVVEVEDTGSGIPENIQSRIFDPFFTTKEVGKGTGLGLSISYGIIKNHHGQIEVKSEEGQGSVFRISLPSVAPIAN